MNATRQLNARIAAYRDPEARELIHFLLHAEVWSVAKRLDMSHAAARDNVSLRALDFLAGLPAELPRPPHEARGSAASNACFGA